jgi:hypothetical protein
MNTKPENLFPMQNALPCPKTDATAVSSPALPLQPDLTNSDQIQATKAINGPPRLGARMRHLLFFLNTMNATRGWHQHPRNGKVARLPESTRLRINRMLEDGLAYRDIIDTLDRADLLPYPLSEMNLSNWYRGGYQDWLAQNLKAELGLPPAQVSMAALAALAAEYEKLQPIHTKSHLLTATKGNNVSDAAPGGLLSPQPQGR